MGTKINKALDLNKLYQEQANGKLLKKAVKFPVLATIKYDGNYTVTEVRNGTVTHYTSGGLKYKHADKGGNIFNTVINGYYIAERIYKAGKKGNRTGCNLTGPKRDQKSTNHTYKVFDYLTLAEYEQGKSTRDYTSRMATLVSETGIALNDIAEYSVIADKEALEVAMNKISAEGWEGLMLMQPNWKWTNTKSRTTDFVKYKDRPTVDLLCIGTEEGKGKYEGMIGSVVLEDMSGRVVKVGSGLTDVQRAMPPSYYRDKVIEIKYEQILDTYIQPTFVRVRTDKTMREID